MNRPRIAIAGFQHETNTFAPGATTYADFEDGGGWPALTRGEALLNAFRPLNISIGGFIAAAEGESDLVPILWTNAEPANRVTADAFDRISAEIIESIKASGPVDAIYLDLHGAMVTDEAEDGEGQLLRRLRAEFGDDLPIAASLDLHANVTSEMMRLADIITIYRTYPHLDMDATGARAWGHLKTILQHGNCPAKAMRQVNFLIPLSAQCTDFGPLSTLYRSLDQLGDHVISADIALGFPLADIADAGPAIVVYGVDQIAVDRAAEKLCARFETHASDLPNQLLPPESAVQRASNNTSPKPVILADVQDNSGAGALADSTGLLKALLARSTGPSLIGALWDPQTAVAAREAGVGETFQATIGGRSGPEGVSPWTGEATVLAVSNGVFVCKGAMQRDVETDVGPSALLRIQGKNDVTDVLITSYRHQAIDREVFHHLGANLNDYDIVGIKSTVHFRADYTPIAAEILMVEAPGYSPCRMTRDMYQALRSKVRV